MSMALGKNLKRKKLIPDTEAEEAKASKSSAKPGKEASAKKASATKKTSPKKSAATKGKTLKKKSTPKKPVEASKKEPKNVEQETAPEIKEKDTPSISEPQIVEVQGHEPTETFKLTEEEKEKRAQYKKKFDGEIKQLRGQQLKLIVFGLAGERFAIDISRAKEVVPTPEIADIPNVPKHIRGIAQVRNRLIIFLDLLEKFQLKATQPAEERQYPYTLTLKQRGELVGILVNDVPETITCNGNDLQSASRMVRLSPIQESYIKALVSLDGKLVFLLAIDELIASDSGLEMASQEVKETTT